jgi:hypothetical protein
MEISDVRRRIREAAERARQTAAERRSRNDEAEREYDAFLSQLATPLFRQIVNVLRADGYPFTLFTPGGSVRMMSDRSAEDYVELTLDAAGSQPQVVGHASHSRGRRVLKSETALGHGGPIRDLTEEDVVEYVLRELGPMIER